MNDACLFAKEDRCSTLDVLEGTRSTMRENMQLICQLLRGFSKYKYSTKLPQMQS